MTDFELFQPSGIFRTNEFAFILPLEHAQVLRVLRAPGRLSLKLARFSTSVSGWSFFQSGSGLLPSSVSGSQVALSLGSSVTFCSPQFECLELHQKKPALKRAEAKD